MLTYIKKHWLFISVIFLFIFFRLPSLFEPNWYGDEGIYLVLGQAIRKGWVLYSQIHDNKPPTLYYLAAIGQSVFGFRLLLSLWLIPTIYVFSLLSKKLLTLKLYKLSTLLFLILTCIPLFEGNIANAEIFMLLPTILGIYLIYSSKRITNYVLLITGLLLGFAFTIKIPVAVEFGFICYWLLITNFNLKKVKLLITYYLLLITSFLFPIFVYLVYFYFKGALNEFLFAALFQNFGYLSSWATGSHVGSATGGGLVTRAIILFGFWLLVFGLHTKKYLSPQITFLSLWFSATIFAVLLSTRPYPHYLIQTLPPLTLILVSIFNPKIIIKVRLFLFGLFLFLVACFFKYQFYVYPIFSYYQNFYFKRNQTSYYGGDIVSDTQLSTFINQHTQLGEKIFVWGDRPFIYVASDRLPIGRFTVAYHIADFQQYTYIYDQLITNFPRYVIYYPQPGRPFPQLDQLVSRYYHPVSVFGSAIVYQNN